MIKADRFIALAFCGLMVACDGGGGEPAAPAPVEPVAPAVTTAAVAYTCRGGGTVAVQYAGAETAVVTYDGRTYQVRAVEAASGARYSGSGIQWWTASRDGMESGTLGRLSASDGGVSAILERCSRPLPPPPGGVVPAVTAAPCRSADLRLSAAGGDAGMGNRVSTLAAQNLGAQACSLTGYPTVVVLDADGDAIETVRAEQTIGNYFRAGSAPTPVVMPPQGRVWFDLAWNVVPDESAGQTTCPEGTSIRMTPPGESAGAGAGVTLAQELAPCGGRVRVSPFRPALADQAPAAGTATPATPTPVAPKAATPSQKSATPKT